MIVKAGTGTSHPIESAAAELVGTGLASTGVAEAGAAAAGTDGAQAPVTVLPGKHHRSGTDLAEADGTGELRLELNWLTDGSVTGFTTGGPVLARRKARRQRLRRSTFVDALNRTDQAAIVFMSGAWLACVYVFWTWWLEPAHRAGLFGLVVNSAVIAYVSGFPVFFTVAANRLRKSEP